METLLLILAAGWFLLKSKKRPLGEDEYFPLVKVVIGEYTEKGYPIQLTNETGYTWELMCTEQEALKIIEDAKRDGATIEEIKEGANVIPNEEEHAQKDIVQLRYRNLGNGIYYVKLDYYDGTYREGRISSEELNLYIRDANRAGGNITTF